MRIVKFLKDVSGYDDLGTGRKLHEFKTGDIVPVSDSFAIDMFNDGAVDLPEETKLEDEDNNQQEPVSNTPEELENKVVEPEETKPAKPASKKKA